MTLDLENVFERCKLPSLELAGKRRNIYLVYEYIKIVLSTQAKLKIGFLQCLVQVVPKAVRIVGFAFFKFAMLYNDNWPLMELFTSLWGGGLRVN